MRTDGLEGFSRHTGIRAVCCGALLELVPVGGIVLLLVHLDLVPVVVRLLEAVAAVGNLTLRE